jgi:hypothetical protein
VRYRSLRVSSLGKWAPQLHTRLFVSGATQVPILEQHACLLPGCHGLWRRFPDVFGYASVNQRDTAVSPDWTYNPRSATPAGLTRIWFRLLPVRSPLLRGYFRFLGVLRCFNSPGALRPLDGNQRMLVGLPHSEIVGSVPAHGSPTLIAAMPRPSSARSAKASTLRSYCLPKRKTCRECLTTLIGRTQALLARRCPANRLLAHVLIDLKLLDLRLQRYVLVKVQTKTLNALAFGVSGPSPLKRDDELCGSQ